MTQRVSVHGSLMIASLDNSFVICFRQSLKVIIVDAASVYIMLRNERMQNCTYISIITS